ncbi:MAG: sigma-70 family RNA polymerase sigma factor [Planctomycetales bacterium]|nr:sigma-70 family RNA polymerase sigma factor [Planctomycetales bacterium]
MPRTSSPSRVTLDEILPQVYEDFRAIASRALKREPEGHSYQTTELVHEAYLRLAEVKLIDWLDEDHVLRAAVGVVRRVLIDYARAKKSQKRDVNKAAALAPEGILLGTTVDADCIDLIALDEALYRLRELDSRKAEIVELKFFGGQDNETTARILSVSPSTVKRDWTLARAWLSRELRR